MKLPPKMARVCDIRTTVAASWLSGISQARSARSRVIAESANIPATVGQAEQSQPERRVDVELRGPLLLPGPRAADEGAREDGADHVDQVVPPRCRRPVSGRVPRGRDVRRQVGDTEDGVDDDQGAVRRPQVPHPLDERAAGEVGQRDHEDRDVGEQGELGEGQAEDDPEDRGDQVSPLRVPQVTDHGVERPCRRGQRRQVVDACRPPGRGGDQPGAEEQVGEQRQDGGAGAEERAEEAQGSGADQHVERDQLRDRDRVVVAAARGRQPGGGPPGRHQVTDVGLEQLVERQAFACGSCDEREVVDVEPRLRRGPGAEGSREHDQRDPAEQDTVGTRGAPPGSCGHGAMSGAGSTVLPRGSIRAKKRMFLARRAGFSSR